MAAVDAAAHAESLYGNKPGLGDDASTKRIQKALTARGFPVAVTGWYNRATTDAYARFQRSLGYTGINANGIPGPSSLAKLGAGRFTISHKVYVGSRTAAYGTKRVNSRTASMLAAADRRVPWTIRVSQGSYCVFQPTPCADASSGTHDGGGVVDISVYGLSADARWRTVSALRTVGFAAWLRTPEQCGCWAAHIHAVAIGDTDMWQRSGLTNRMQVADYYVGRNGLSNHVWDNTPVQYRVPFTWWERYAGL
ncbi:MAG TPA: peptidoglycan-binding protein [Propionibacteriaceae bacterium]|nr:peptidoglycan-binding protein [Propionibacteriaceae bacterium]